MCLESPRVTLRRFLSVVIFGAAFGYIEAAVVVYLRTIFPHASFTFPLVEFGTSPLWKQLLPAETGREAATLILILTSSWLFGRNLRQRFAYFLTIFACWDISYYLWLKVLINWPGSVTDWDILFLIPITWAGPVLAPILISLTLLIFAVIILYRSAYGRAIKTTVADWLGFCIAALVVVTCFCIAGLHIAEPNFKSFFYWPIFAFGQISAVALFIKCLTKSK